MGPHIQWGPFVVSERTHGLLKRRAREALDNAT